MIASAKARTTFTATPPHVPSGTQPSGSASAGVSNSPSSASAPTLADAQADQRPLELGPGALLVRGGRWARGEDLLSAVTRLLRSTRVDLLSVFGRVGQHDHAVTPNVHESTEHAEEIDASRAQQARDRAQEVLAAGPASAADEQRARAELQRALVRLRVSEGRRRRR